MRVTKRQLRRIVRESCAMGAEETSFGPDPSGGSAEWMPTADVPSPEDYETVRDMLDQNSNLIDMGISLVMVAAGTSCERSTAQGIIDHLQDMLRGPEEEEFSFTGGAGGLPGEEAFGIGYEAGTRGLE